MIIDHTKLRAKGFQIQLIADTRRNIELPLPDSCALVGFAFEPGTEPDGFDLYVNQTKVIDSETDIMGHFFQAATGYNFPFYQFGWELQQNDVLRTSMIHAGNDVKIQLVLYYI